MSAYQVKLGIFEGPLDLLLHLIERHDLDITAISLATVADQYLEYLHALDHPHPAILAEFLSIAAKLLLLKSLALLPTSKEMDSPAVLHDEAEEMATDLTQQLLEYKRFKAATAQLQQRQDQGLRSYVRPATPSRPPLSSGLNSLILADLVTALQRVLRQHSPPGEEMAMPRNTFTIGDKIELISNLLRRDVQLGFDALTASATSRLEVIVTFLALLELLKTGRVGVRQDKLFGEILIFAVATPESHTNS
ncbi:MAG: segregation/condensation protein A [Chloroflexi bacterium]|nr:segregation/condensation protein A [Chloroflexota bacterium]MCL5074709.1 segregation/condensation protein A [Chloroflexota bacterium]